MSEKPSEQLTLEERFEELEAIIEQMESGDISLDQSFALYKEGLAQMKAANEMLDSVEKAMLALNEDGELEEFI